MFLETKKYYLSSVNTCKRLINLFLELEKVFNLF